MIFMVVKTYYYIYCGVNIVINNFNRWNNIENTWEEKGSEKWRKRLKKASKEKQEKEWKPKNENDWPHKNKKIGKAKNKTYFSCYQLKHFYFAFLCFSEETTDLSDV